jgi:hypothetical protein
MAFVVYDKFVAREQHGLIFWKSRIIQPDLLTAYIAGFRYLLTPQTRHQYCEAELLDGQR